MIPPILMMAHTELPCMPDWPLFIGNLMLSPLPWPLHTLASSHTSCQRIAVFSSVDLELQLHVNFAPRPIQMEVALLCYKILVEAQVFKRHSVALTYCEI